MGLHYRGDFSTVGWGFYSIIIATTIYIHGADGNVSGNLVDKAIKCIRKYNDGKGIIATFAQKALSDLPCHDPSTTIYIPGADGNVIATYKNDGQ